MQIAYLKKKKSRLRLSSFEIWNADTVVSHLSQTFDLSENLHFRWKVFDLSGCLT